MEKVEFRCPACRGTVSAPAALEGRAAACPRCKALVAAWPEPLWLPVEVEPVPPPPPPAGAFDFDSPDPEPEPATPSSKASRPGKSPPGRFSWDRIGAGVVALWGGIGVCVVVANEHRMTPGAAVLRGFLAGSALGWGVWYCTRGARAAELRAVVAGLRPFVGRRARAVRDALGDPSFSETAEDGRRVLAWDLDSVRLTLTFRDGVCVAEREENVEPAADGGVAAWFDPFDPGE